MSEQTTAHSPEFQAIITQVETALAQAAEDARELAERTGTPLVVRDVRENQTRKAGRRQRRQIAR
jgi:ribosomal protein S9